MKIIEDYIDNISIDEKLSIALGTFDGVHRGHKELIKSSICVAKEMAIASAVLTFDNHPLKILKPEANIKIITNNKMKAEIIESLGIDYLIFVKFTKDLAGIDEKKFIEILVNKYKCSALTCGYNYTYGKFGHGNISTLKSHQKEFNYKLSILDKITYDGNDISSSLIRHKIEIGNIQAANNLLGYNYYIKGNVIKGKQLGRKLDFPTANIEITDNLCLKNGVYVSLTNIDGKLYKSVSNIGKNPTVGDTKRMFETHIFNFNDDIYNKTISVELLDFVRSENKFNSIEELKERVFMDIDISKEYFLNHDIYNMKNV
jgi:riboflavin kinase / FMN adenylyltransferase